MKLFIIISLLVIIIVVLFLAHFGYFSKVTIQEKMAGGYTLIYEDYVGDYKNTGGVMNKIYFSLLNEDKIESYKGFGIYYDNPEKIEKEKLRSKVGCILEEKDKDKISLLKEKYNITDYPEKKSMIAEFPYKGKLSILFGIMKVYPKITKYINEKHLQTPIMEIYDIPGGKIYYILPLE